MSEKITLPIVINVTEDQACWIGAWMESQEQLGLPARSLLEAIQDVFDKGAERAKEEAELVAHEKPDGAWRIRPYLAEHSAFRIGWRSHAGKPPMGAR